METLTTKLRPAIMSMEPGETKTFPIERMKSIRSQASEIGAIYDRVYTTRTDRAARTIEITREK